MGVNVEKKIKIMTIFGTRPEAIKMAPLIKELEKETAFHTQVVLTGQHKDQLQQVMDAFQIKADHNLEIMKPNQTLVDINTAILTKLDPILKADKPDMVLVHGDTSTSLAAAMVAFYHQIPIGHVEAGLRSYDKYQPFPEEVNRRLLTHVSDLHFAPTETAKDNLMKENVQGTIYVTGNTAIDAMAYTIKAEHLFTEQGLNQLDFTKKIIIVTAHRRENLGEPLAQICQAIVALKAQHPELQFVYPLHLNPAVRGVARQLLGNIEGIYLTEPLDIFDMHNLMAKSYLILTDSGGLQEEAPHLDIPVLVLRNVTERPEGLTAGVAKLVGTDPKAIAESVNHLLTDTKAYEQMAKGKNPFGDGTASRQIVAGIKAYFV